MHGNRRCLSAVFAAIAVACPFWTAAAGLVVCALHVESVRSTGPSMFLKRSHSIKLSAPRHLILCHSSQVCTGVAPVTRRRKATGTPDGDNVHRQQ
ncbi:hypothetical protein BGW80DRAFT_1313155 [Lactifluus volemus]|nr:hypothetical protein BGW80DRAFT_1313155 [Lactifluus volemus]